MSPLDRRLLRQVTSYLVVGGTTAVIYYLLIYVLYEVLGTHHLLAVSIAYVTAVLFHFMANRRVTFGSSGDAKGQIARYVIFAALIYVITIGIVAVSMTYLGVSVYLATTLAIVVTLLVGFSGLKHWVFAVPTKS